MLKNAKEIFTVEFNPNIGIHVEPGTMGIAFYTENWEFLLEHPWLILVALFISTCITSLWYVYSEYKWPFHKSRRRW